MLTMASKDEQLANDIGNSRKLLKKRLLEAKGVMSDNYRQFFANSTFDFDKKRLVGNDGYYLQWKLREFPDKEVSYHNQQTSRGHVGLYRIKP